MAKGRTKRVLFVAYYFPPRGGAGVQRSLKFVKYLRSFGWEPTVLTCEYDRRSKSFDRSLLSEVPDGTRVVAVPSSEEFFIGLSRLGLGRLTGLFLRPDAMITWSRAALAAARKLHREEPFDLVYTSVQPWSMGLIGMRIKGALSLPWVLDFRDPWSDSLHLTWPSRLHWMWDRRMEGRIVRRADTNLVVTPTMRDRLLETHPSLDPEAVKVLYNGYDDEDFDAVGAGDESVFKVVFTGRFQYDHGAPEQPGAWKRLREAFTYRPKSVILETHSPICLLKGLARFLERFPERRSKVRFVFAGTVGAGNMALARELGLDDVVECPGYLPHGESVGLVKSADALFLPMFSTPDPTERVAYASGKVFEYMAARKPILALTQAGDARDIAVESGLGLPVEPRDVEGVAQALSRLYDTWKSGSAAMQPNEEYIRGFSRKALTQRLAQTFDELLEKETPR